MLHDRRNGCRSTANGGEDCVRAMILAAGLGTRMRPLTAERAKPALPVRGRPVVSLLLELLERQGIREVLINLHHLPDSIRRAVEADRPAQLAITWSNEEKPLGTGGGIRRAAEFLRESETGVVLAGDMLLDVDLVGLHARHVASGRDATLLLRRDRREATFGSVGVDAEGRIGRIGRHGISRATAETDRGLFTGIRFFDREVLTEWPVREVFEDLRDWLMPRAESGAIRLGAEIVDGPANVWEPVGTPEEYLQVNLVPPDLPHLGGSATVWQGAIDLLGRERDVIAARSVRIPGDAELARCVVWDGARVPAGAKLCDGVFGARGFYAAAPLADGRLGGETGIGPEPATESRGAA